MHSFAKFLGLLWFYSFWNKATVTLFKDFVFVLFPYREGIFWHSEKEATFLWGVPFSNSLSALFFILYGLFSARHFVATNAMIVKFQNVDKQCIR